MFAVLLCHDISLALSYLHSNGIVHRDLSSNNVLPIAGSRAKVTDFGMVKLYDVNRSTAHLTPLTLCPGTVACMSPEALGEPPVYTDKLDSFSLGILGVQIMTRQFPEPGDRFKIIEISDPRIPLGSVKVDIPEIERRQSHISLINPAHPLLPVALDCLKDKDRERPSCHEFCGRVSSLKASPKYTESVQQSGVRTEPARSDGANREREVLQVRDLQQQLQGQQLEIQQQKQQIDLLTENNDQLQTQITGKDTQLEQKEAAIATLQYEIQQLRQQLQSSEQVTAEFQRNLLESEKTVRDQQRQIRELQQQLRQRSGQRGEEEVQEEASGAAANGGSIKLRWRDGGKAPRKVYGESAAVNGRVAYFIPGEYTVLAYDSAKTTWSQISECPNHDFSLAMVNSLLTAIGGKTPNGNRTSSLFSLTDKKWTEQFPPMPTKRWLTAVVCGGRSLVVAGGEGEGYKKLNTVEIMDAETLQWSTASSLQHPLHQATATLCGDQIYMVGGFNHRVASRSVFTCSLTTLLQSCQPKSKPLGSQLKTLSLAKVWHQLADTPVTHSTCASLNGLLAVGGKDSGGKDSDGKPTTAIHAYNTTNNSWEIISHMATPRSGCLVAVLPHNELMVVGGFAPELTDSVEIAAFPSL